MTSFVTVQLGLLDPLYSLFGWVLGGLYSWLNNYGLVIILFTVIIRALLLPLGLRSQRSSLRQQMLQSEVNEIKRRYPNDAQKVQTLTQQLYKENGISMTSDACLYLAAGGYLADYLHFPCASRFITAVPVHNLTKIGEVLQGQGLMTEAQVKNIAIMDIPILNGLRDSGSALSAICSGG